MIILIKNGVVESLVLVDQTQANAMGYDLALPVADANRRANGWQVGATFYPDAAYAQEQNGKTMEANAELAMTSLRAYIALAAPTNAQTIAVVRLLCRVCLALIRFRLNKMDQIE